MGKIITLSGCRGIGKSTLIRGLKKKKPSLYIREGFQKIDQYYDMNLEDEYYENEREYIKRQIEEINEIKKKNVDAMLLRGPEDLEFYALHFPRSQKKTWNVEASLEEELKKLHLVKSDYVLYLTASRSTILSRCINDKKKLRDNIDDWLDNWQPFIDEYMRRLDNVIILNTDNMSIEDVLEWTYVWMESL